jgi:arylsulfatase A-like enzyme
MSACARTAALLLATAAWALVEVGCSGIVWRAAPSPVRSVVIITLDTMRADRLPAYGFNGVATPALDRLAAEGVLFEQAFAATPLTLPSHATLFTGLFPPRLGVRDNAGASVAPAFRTLAEVLSGHGLATAAFVASSVLAPERGLDQGFATYSTGQSARCPGSARARRPADAVMDESLGWLETFDSGPFFLWVHLYDTHRPHRLPADYTRAYADPYAAAIAFEDAQIARLVAHLEARGRLDDTLIVVAGDHGESLGDHGEDGHGIFIYQEALHVPLMFRGPGLAPRRVRAPVRLADVTPTILELVGEEPPPLDGISLGGLITGGAEGRPREVYAESLYPQRFGWAPLRSLRADRYKLIDAPRPELYDLQADPREQRNIFASSPAVAAAMRRRLRSFEPDPAKVGDPPAPDPALAARLASLGYVSGSADAKSGAPDAAPDPKDVIATFNEMTKLQWERGMRTARLEAPCPAAR